MDQTENDCLQSVHFLICFYRDPVGGEKEKRKEKKLIPSSPNNNIWKSSPTNMSSIDNQIQ